MEHVPGLDFLFRSRVAGRGARGEGPSSEVLVLRSLK
jgi:hypothetical protein